MDNLLLLKLGGSLLTNKEEKNSANVANIKRLVKEIHQARKIKKIPLIIAHGAGSYAHAEAKKYQTHKGFINTRSLEGMIKVADVAASFNRMIVKEFLEVGEYAISVSPFSCIVASSDLPHSVFFEQVKELLKIGALPVLYGDVIIDNKKGCTIFSAEKILSLLALSLQKSYHIEKAILLSNTDGVWDKNKNIIPKITPRNIKLYRSSLGKAKGFDVTGGMEHKVMEALFLAKRGIPSFIMNGNIPLNLQKLLLGESVPGTVISAK